ncbi:RNA polymerase sigma-70 factor [Nonlabens ulvanivorans]|nr:RNA polymerase sigma factor [Nonlabens ulvanivorans]GAK89951.1 RNA polymerase sigma-70 factor [Nonlabens ulvanivorans]GAK93695.1 RNA polymerase sigma-70 factor [Nonlabens ulvanivorans]
MKVIQLYTNEKKLIEKAAAGDRKAQKHLYEKHASRMLSVCRQYVSPVELAEELMLNGFFKVFTKLDSFSHQGSFEGWVRRIMVRECIDYLRKKDPFKYSSSIDEEKEPACIDEDTDEDIDMNVLQQAIDGLPIGYKTVFVMFAIDGFKHGEIAQVLQISESTSKTQFRKARLMLQEELKMMKKKHYEA